MATGTVRAGLIGCGNIAKIHASGLARSPNVTFAACCDVDESRARAMAEEHGAPHVFASPEALLASGEVDAVMVCTPHPSHAAVVVAAAEAGVHILCEKPITIDLTEADRMVETARQAGVKFGVIFQRRWWPAAQRIRQAIDAGKLGRLTLGECAVRIWRSADYFGSAAWRGTWANEGGGVLMNQAVHAIDQFQWFMGPAVEVVGRYATLRHGAYIDVEDTAVATVVFANGALGTIQAASSFNPGFGFRVAVHGDADAAVSVWEREEGQQGVNDIWTIPGEEPLREEWEQAEQNRPGFPSFHHEQIQDFAEAILEDREPLVTGEEGRKSLELILAIYESSRTGAAVPLPMRPGRPSEPDCLSLRRRWSTGGPLRAADPAPIGAAGPPLAAIRHRGSGAMSMAPRATVPVGFAGAARLHVGGLVAVIADVAAVVASAHPL